MFGAVCSTGTSMAVRGRPGADKGSMVSAGCCSGAKHAMLGLEPVMSHLDKHLEALRACLLRTAETLPILLEGAHTCHCRLALIVL